MLRFWRRDRRPKPRRLSERAHDDLVEVCVGFDRLHAAMLHARCQAEGIETELLTMDENGLVPGIAALAEHKLLVRRRDLDRLEPIVTAADRER